ncbi:MAG: polysaccharide deacetylase family protein [Propionibacteriales bacterium]|nr:polysaccharide deacetylase family protein [Propionibacteriales bacterium]
MSGVRTDVKRLLARASSRRPAEGATLLIYHRVGGGATDELDVPAAAFAAQLDVLAGHRVVALDDALDALDRGDRAGRVVLTFDDGFRDVYDHAWPLLRERGVPFTVYVATRYIGGVMHWEGSTAADVAAPALSWEQLAEMVTSGLCTVGNHTHGHVPPELLCDRELDRCTDDLQDWLAVTPRHFAYTWGTPVRSMEPALRRRFRSAATGRLGRNLPGADPMRLARVPVRRTDPVEFFEAKLGGGLLSERVYGGIVATAKRVGVRG